MDWLLLPAESVPADDGWLAPEERAVLATLRFERRRRDWRLGRWTAKQALLASQLAGASADEIAILADEDGAPHVFLGRRPAACSLSISHREGYALAVAAAGGTRLGCDLEAIEPRSDAFVADYFTERERRLVAAAPSEEHARLANLVWSAKESAVKALGTGWRVDTRSVEVELSPGPAHAGWNPLHVRCVERDLLLQGWWRRQGPLLLTVVWPAGMPPTGVLNAVRSDPVRARPASAA